MYLLAFYFYQPSTNTQYYIRTPKKINSVFKICKTKLQAAFILRKTVYAGKEPDEPYRYGPN